MKKAIFLFTFIVLIPLLIFSVEGVKLKVGVILSGCGIQDGTEISEAVLTMLYLEKAQAEMIYMAPDIKQANVINHYKSDQKSAEERNVIVESARITRGKIKDIKEIKSKDLDILIVVGGLGAGMNLSDLFSKGADFKVNPDLEKLINEMYDSKKTMGFMCVTPVILSKILGKYGIKVTIGKNEGDFVKMISSFGAKHIECTVDNIVIDEKNKIVTTPAFMIGPSTSDVAAGIEKLVKQVVKMAKKK